MYKHVLIATDGSPLSERAVDAGIALASTLKAALTIANVGAPYAPPLYAGDLVPNNYLTANEHDEKVRTAGQEVLDAAQAKAGKAGLTADTAFEIADEPADGIIKIAKDRKADLIVVASHGRGGLSALLLGSATRRLLSSANIDLLVVRNHDGDEGSALSHPSDTLAVRPPGCPEARCHLRCRRVFCALGKKIFS